MHFYVKKQNFSELYNLIVLVFFEKKISQMFVVSHLGNLLYKVIV
jgi:hypothetical protein